jgi:hypothetical protein
MIRIKTKGEAEINILASKTKRERECRMCSLLQESTWFTCALELGLLKRQKIQRTLN